MYKNACFKGLINPFCPHHGFWKLIHLKGSIREILFADRLSTVVSAKTQVGRACRRQQQQQVMTRAMERGARECGAWHALRIEGGGGRGILIYATGQTAASNQLDPATPPYPSARSGLLSAL